MTERKWLTSTNPTALLTHLRGKASQRKLRLFVCICSRRAWTTLSDQARAAVLVAERLADGLATEEERQSAYEDAGGDWSALFTQADCLPAKALVSDNLETFALDAVGSTLAIADPEGRYILPVEPDRVRDEHRALAGLLRCIFGNPLHPFVLEGAWRSAEAIGLAQAAYDQRLLPSGELDSQRLAVLADALEEGGAGEGILEHLRGPGPHARGCWAVDAVLARM